MESIVDVLFYIGEQSFFIQGVHVWAPMALEMCIGWEMTSTSQLMECATADGGAYQFTITGGYQL